MIERIKELERLSASINPGFDERREMLGKVINYSDSFLENISSLPSFVFTEDKGRDIYKSPIAEEGVPLDELLNVIKNNVDTPGVNPASPGYLGYIPGGGIYYSALGDYLADITNRYSGIFFLSPGAVRMENMLTAWMAGLAGYPDSAGGNLTSGGSIANLTAVVTARDYAGIEGAKVEKGVIYLSDHAHHSVDKAIRIAGLNSAVRRYLKTYDNFRIIPEELERQILQDKKEGLIPFLIIASAGTTNTGSVDPLESIGDIAQKHSVWFHIDAAYGGFFLLSETGRKVLQGMDKSDSIVMDPHKGLFLPYGTGAIIIKDKMKMLNSHYFQANYMQDSIDPENELSPSDLSPEMSKHFRGLRLWLPLKIAGVKAFRTALEEKILLAQYFHGSLSEIKNMEVGPFPDLSIVTYRYIPQKGDPNEFNKKLINEVQRDGRIFISSTMLNGKFVLRLVVLSFRTHLEQINTLIDVLKEKIKLLENN